MGVSKLLLGAIGGGLGGHVYAHYISGDPRALPYAGFGAAAGALLAALFLTDDSPSVVLVTTPATPVVTRGAFAGAPRPLYRSGDQRFAAPSAVMAPGTLQSMAPPGAFQSMAPSPFGSMAPGTLQSNWGSGGGGGNSAPIVNPAYQQGPFAGWHWGSWG